MSRLPILPPALVERLLAGALDASPYRDDIVGDLREAFTEVASRRVASFAYLWYCAQAVRLMGRYAWRRRPAIRARRHTMDRLWMDLRLAARGLVKRPLFAASIVVTLALGIGANA
ncbi:MAG TPA: hypothetical protein VF219_14980, partial [Vicinamibacterales bacterium]